MYRSIVLISGFLMAIIVYVSLEVFSYGNIGSIVGLGKSFGLFSILAPSLGFSSATFAGVLLAFVRRFFWQTHSMSGWLFRAAHLPTIGAMMYWTLGSFAVCCMVPFICMLLFWMHPVGAQAWPYAVYWIIPIVIYYRTNKGIFLTALGSTFTAHALGSVIWVYTVNMTSAQWMGLIPIVIFERFICATISVGCYYFFTHLSRAVQHLVTQVYNRIVNGRSGIHDFGKGNA